MFGMTPTDFPRRLRSPSIGLLRGLRLTLAIVSQFVSPDSVVAEGPNGNQLVIDFGPVQSTVGDQAPITSISVYSMCVRGSKMKPPVIASGVPFKTAEAFEKGIIN